MRHFVLLLLLFVFFSAKAQYHYENEDVSMKIELISDSVVIAIKSLGNKCAYIPSEECMLCKFSMIRVGEHIQTVVLGMGYRYEWECRCNDMLYIPSDNPIIYKYPMDNDIDELDIVLGIEIVEDCQNCSFSTMSEITGPSVSHRKSSFNVSIPLCR